MHAPIHARHLTNRNEYLPGSPPYYRSSMLSSILRHIGVVFAVALTLAASAWAQSGGVALSLSEAVERARTDNYSVRQAEADRQIAEAGVHQTRAVFLPRLSASETVTATTDPLNAFGFKLRQERVAQQDFAPGLLNDPDRVDNFGTQVQVQQPVLNPSGLFERRAAKSRLAASSHVLERTGHVVAFQVQQTYFGLALARQRARTLEAALEAARATLAQTQHLHEQGLITRADLLSARVRVLELESQLAESENAAEETADRLRYLVGLRADVPLALTDSLAEPTPVAEAPAVDGVNETRSDMQALRRQIDAASERVRARRFAFLPSLNLFGSYEWNDEAALGFDGEGWTAGATLRWNLFQGYEQAGAAEQARAELQRARLAYEDQARQNAIELDAARRTLATTRDRLALARTAVEQARENLRIRSDRYGQGLEQTTDVLAAEVALANARLRRLQTLYDHTVAAYRLELLTEQPLVRR